MFEDNERGWLLAALGYPEEAPHLVFTYAIDIEHVTAQGRLCCNLLGLLAEIGGIDLIPRAVAQVTGHIHGLSEDLTALHAAFHSVLRRAPARQNGQFAQIIFVPVFRSCLILLQRIQP